MNWLRSNSLEVLVLCVRLNHHLLLSDLTVKDLFVESRLVKKNYIFQQLQYAFYIRVIAGAFIY